MKHVLAGLALALAVAAAGCGGSQKKEPAAPKGPTRDDVAANAKKQILGDEGAQVDQPLRDAIAQAAADVFRTRCATDGWSAEATTCLATADNSNVGGCQQHLTEAQQKSLAEGMFEWAAKYSDQLEEDARREPESEMAPPPAPGAAPPTPADPCGGDE